MNAKSRLAQLEKQKPQVKMTWAEFITADVETVDAYAKANGLPTWAEFIADTLEDVPENYSTKPQERL